ncbi:hypothetical protein DdX_15141 [Ditylenchus destructor]|uniref:Uncharacterized protein n=1 Tax=Ditylenchus destructor TaxID=166010 RepID=A0AAD4MT49_9BILA|nr:hypothetical protein DdX_15141 [Ditylenchus destructor]
MLCLRRISLNAKSRLLFLNRTYSSRNDSMVKSIAIFRLIHNRLLQQNDYNSPQAVFVFFQKRWVRTEVPEEKGKSSDDKDNSDAETSESEFKFGFGPSGAKPKNKWEEGLYRHLKEKCEKSGKSEEEFEQMLRETDPDKVRRRHAPARLLARIKKIAWYAFKEYLVLVTVVICAGVVVWKLSGFRAKSRAVVYKEEPKP